MEMRDKEGWGRGGGVERERKSSGREGEDFTEGKGSLGGIRMGFGWGECKRNHA